MNSLTKIDNLHSSKLPILVQGEYHPWERYLHTKIAPLFSPEIGNQLIHEKWHEIGSIPTRDDIIYDIDKIPLQPTYARILTDIRFTTGHTSVSIPSPSTPIPTSLDVKFDLLTRKYANLSGIRSQRSRTPSPTVRTIPANLSTQAPGNLSDWLKDPIFRRAYLSQPLTPAGEAQLDRHISRHLTERDRLMAEDREVVKVIFASIPDDSFSDIEVSPLYSDFVDAPLQSWSRSLLFKLAIKDVFEGGNATVKRAKLATALSLSQGTLSHSVFMQQIKDAHSFLVKDFCVLVNGRPYIDPHHLAGFIYIQGVDRTNQCNLTNTFHDINVKHPSGKIDDYEAMMKAVHATILSETKNNPLRLNTRA